MNSLRSEGIPAPDLSGENEGEYEEGEYEQPRSLADRLGDWLELRLHIARERHDGEAAFREAEIARQVALLEARTSRETSLAEAHNKLRAAHLKAQAARAGGSGSGLGADKGRGGGAGRGGGSGSGRGSGGSSGAGGGKPGGGRGPGGGAGRGTAGPNSSGSGGKGPGSGKGSGGRGSGGNSGSGGRGSGGGAGGGRKNGGKGSGSGGSNGSGGRGPGGGSRDGRGSGRDTAASPRAERARGRQERRAARRAARQAARQQRAADRQAAGLADRTKDRDLRRGAQERARRRKEKAARRKEKERQRERDAKDAARAADRASRTTFGDAVAQEAQRRWDKRRADTDTDRKPEDGGAKPQDKDTAKTPPNAQEKPPGGPSDGSAGGAGVPGPDAAGKAQDGPSDGSGDGPHTRHGKRSWRDLFDKPGPGEDSGKSGGAGGAGSPFGRDRTPPTAEWPGRPARTGTPPPGEDDVVDAVIVDDPGDPFGTWRARRAGLPRASRKRRDPSVPQQEIKRPGTTRPVSSEGSTTSVSSTEVTRPSGQGGLAAQHRTDITFDDFLVRMVNIAIQAAADQERAEALMEALDKVADALREMAADLVGDHNIDTAVTDLIADLADAAGRMKRQTEVCATECSLAVEAAKLAAEIVSRVYGQDMAAKEDAGLTFASAAAHHD
ncbi:ATP/GTP-binding protein [Streptomyces sp. NPDC096040]|uniref:ATP/GTP-binding protein n=1 Tax=Streptomyces sp. NPDC096040 TaxID=3155541 RepID=UPI0033344212